MKSFKRIGATLLCVCAVLSAVTVTACGENGASDGKDKEHVTTVADVQEWASALDVFSLNNFSMSEVNGYEHDVFVDGKIDVENLKADFTSQTKWGNYYFEYSDGMLWKYGENNLESEPAEETGAKDAFIGALTNTNSDHVVVTLAYLYLPVYATEQNKNDFKTLSQLYGEFEYKDGSYKTKSVYMDGVDSALNIKISLKDGLLEHFELSMSFVGGDGDTITQRNALQISDINSTVVKTPEKARAAIDAEKAKG